ncbi:hypothetical protein P1J78_03735 [Psychromarinibacter sp. C21-152]|uniref:Uncharacterized protein n=1 Tax=Psychromarinibacter sediminicola TaxID=3033385 RepID=A0AAE3NSP1_9RHOB|nr:hypothetical protein [Psychromarinibacter sediminicola]MDF0599837.1 hypothetical protein [Psychromarinibacter sediminicola]
MPRFPFRPLLLGAALAGLAAGTALAQSENGDEPYWKTQCDDDCPTMEDKRAAEAAAQAWLDGMPEDGFQVRTVNATAVYEDKVVSLADGGERRIVNIHAYGGAWPTTLHLSGPVHSGMSPAELQARVESFSHDGFPVPGLSVEHWRIEAQTPSSHVEEGIEILEVAPGRVRFRVRTSFFALYGFDTRMPEIMDAPTPEEAYFQIRTPFRGEALVTYEVAGF